MNSEDNYATNEGQLNFNSWGCSTKDEIGIKYANSYYLSKEDNFPGKN
jgi:hypothetical protein